MRPIKLKFLTRSPFHFLFILLVLVVVAGCKNDDEPPVEGTFEVLSMEVTQNPSGIAPLTALIELTTSHNTSASITVLGDRPITKNFEARGQDHSLPVIGLYPDQVNQVVLTLTNNSGESLSDTISLTTGPLPDYLPEVNIVEKREEAMEEGWNFLMCNIGRGADGFFTSPLMFDEDGAIRWYLIGEEEFSGGAGPFEPMRNGNLLAATSRWIIEYNMLGEKVNIWTMAPNYNFHHDLVEKPNGNFVVAVDDNNLNTVEDIAIEIDRVTSAEVARWDLRQILDMSRMDLIQDEVDWFHMNAIWYDEQDDALIFSGRNQGLVKVSADNELIWILSPHKGWGQAGINGDGFDTKDFLLTAVDGSNAPFAEEVQLGTQAIPDFDWTWGQHAPMILDNRNIFVFDNGFNRNFNPAGTHSRGVEYRIDEENMTVQEVWQSGKERGTAFQSRILSDVDVMPQTGNRIVFAGIHLGQRMSQLIEVTYPNNETVFEAQIVYKYAFIPPNSPLAPGYIDASFRAERMDPYTGY